MPQVKLIFTWLLEPVTVIEVLATLKVPVALVLPPSPKVPVTVEVTVAILSVASTALLTDLSVVLLS